ncbi:DUF4326 domain-containing protein [Streptomyces violaceoruber]
MPQRVQRKRTRGWRAPEGAAYVGRGTRYGNPWAVIQTNTGTGWAVQWAGHADQHRPLGLNDFVPANDQRDAHALAVELFETWVYGLPQLLERAQQELAGRDLMCWCAESLPCHADLLLQLANMERNGL